MIAGGVAMRATAATLPVAGGLALMDGPLPFGDIVGAIGIAGSLIYDVLTLPISGPMLSESGEGDGALSAPRPPAIPNGWDGTTPPAVGWRWRGPDAPGGERGAWVSPDGKESLLPDFGHTEPPGPHVDWNAPGKGRWRIFPDGTIKPKKP